jgi:hypothetical protein
MRTVSSINVETSSVLAIMGRKGLTGRKISEERDKGGM